MALIPQRPVPLESKRIPLDRRILLRFTSFEWFAAEYSQNLSMTGMFVRSSEPQPAGTPLDFEFKLQDGLPLIRGKGWVVWSREADLGKERPAGMGIEFLELDRESRRLIRWMVQNELPEDREPFDLRAVRDDDLPEPLSGEHEARDATIGWVPLVAGVAVVSLTSLASWWWGGRETTAPGDEVESAVVANEGSSLPADGALPSATSVSGPADPRSVPTGVSRSVGEPVPVAGTPAASTRADDLLRVVRAWADAWSRQDVEAYLASYSRRFVPAAGVSLDEWRALRRRRILKPARIRIAVTGFEVVSRASDEAEVRFTQAYRSDSYSDSVEKTLRLVREAGTWKIHREAAR